MSDSGLFILKSTGLTRRVVSPSGDLTIVDKVELTISAGEAVAIVGPSGAGKSTLLGLLAGLENPSSGEVWLDGESFSTADEDGRARLRAGRVGFVFQSFHLLAGLTALENVILPLELAGQRAAAVQAGAMLETVGLADRIHHYPNQLSGGEQQRVALARAFVIRPKILFADEPTGNLDKATGEQIADSMFSLRRDNNTTLVLVTHNTQLAARCDRVFGMESGRMVEWDS
jgi:putative ABC transport system ATP-binding protein